MPLDVLTPRQREVLTLIANGYTQAEAAEHLGIGAETVKSQVTGLLKRLGARSMPHAAMMFGRAGCDEPPLELPRRVGRPRDSGTVDDPDQRAYLDALDRYLKSRTTDTMARIDMLIALTNMRDQASSSSPKEGA